MTAGWVVVAAVGAVLLLAVVLLWCRHEDREDRRYWAACRAADARYVAARWGVTS